MRQLTTILFFSLQLLATIAIAQNGVAFRLIENDYNLGNLGSAQSSRDIIKWAFEKVF